MSELITPQIMANAKVDLASTIEGKFSPHDWELILRRAHAQLLEQSKSSTEQEAWKAVIRDFHAAHYWGFAPNFREPRGKKKKNLGYQFIWLMLGSLTFMKVAILWFGQIYSRSDESSDKWIFFIVLILVFGNILFFLWRNRNYVD